MSNAAEPSGFDFHCHIDLYPDPAGMISLCETSKVMTLAVTTTPRAWQQNQKWAAASDFVFPAAGLHPELVGQRYHEIGLLEQLMKDTTLIGEVGLDGSPKYKPSWEKQIEVFTRVLKMAQKLDGHVISIHSRRAANEVVSLIEAEKTCDRALCILHWFSGPQAVAAKAAEMGCYFSVNHQMLRSKHGAELVRELPIETLLTETDGPFTEEAGRKQEPSDVLRLPELLGELRQVSSEAMGAALKNNARRVFAFAGISF